MHKIKNIKTAPSHKQKKDRVIALKAKKKFYLKDTDWTQLHDVEISNRNEIKKWRDKLRKFTITEDYESSEKRLEAILQDMPEPRLENNIQSEDNKDYNVNSEINSKVDLKDFYNLRSEFKKLQERVTAITQKENENQKILLDEKQARSFAREIFLEYKNKRMIDNGILEYNMMRTLLEEAIDRRISPDSHGPLLEEYLNSNDKISIEDIIENCREFFKNINGLYVSLTIEQRNLYNMSTSELNNWFKENGHRYRCYDKD